MIWSCSGSQLSEPAPDRLVLKFRQACRGAGIGRGEQARVVAAMGETRLRLRQRAALRCRDKAEDDSALPDGIGKHLIVGGKFLDLVTQAGEGVGLRPEAQCIGRRHAVRLGEDHVETDRRGAIAGELLDELGKHGARPGPLPDTLQRLLVDVDDAERQGWVELARADLLIGVEHDGPQSRDRARIPDPQDERRCDHCPDNEGIEQTRTNHCRQTPRDLNTRIPRRRRQRRLKPSRWRPRDSMSNGHWGSSNNALFAMQGSIERKGGMN